MICPPRWFLFYPHPLFYRSPSNVPSLPQIVGGFLGSLLGCCPLKQMLLFLLVLSGSPGRTTAAGPLPRWTLTAHTLQPSSSEDRTQTFNHILCGVQGEHGGWRFDFLFGFDSFCFVRSLRLIKLRVVEGERPQLNTSS